LRNTVPFVRSHAPRAEFVAVVVPLGPYLIGEGDRCGLGFQRRTNRGIKQFGWNQSVLEQSREHRRWGGNNCGGIQTKRFSSELGIVLV